MRKLHLAVGVLTVMAFLITGQLMRHHVPAMRTLEDGERLLFRSRHVYILASGLVNLMLGLYLQRWAGAWRTAFQIIGSILLIAAPVLLLLAFHAEPRLGIHAHLWRGAMGLFALFGGCMLHLLSSLGSPAPAIPRAEGR
jgi:hypothetical protein